MIRLLPLVAKRSRLAFYRSLALFVAVLGLTSPALPVTYGEEHQDGLANACDAAPTHVCKSTFPPLPRSKWLIITHVSCSVRVTGANRKIQSFSLSHLSSTGASTIVGHALVPVLLLDNGTTATYHVNEQVRQIVPSEGRPQITVAAEPVGEAAKRGNIGPMICSISGSLRPNPV